MEAEMSRWPVVRARGAPFERGEQYGQQVADRVRRSVEIYSELFRYHTGLEWEEICGLAAGFKGPIAGSDAEILPELEGIAAGAGVRFDDILALNVRTEVMYGLASARECTSIVALPEATEDGHTLLAQNWDWHAGTAETCVLLVMAPEGRPAFVSLVEAGLLAKAGLNSCGIGVVTNALRSDRDAGSPGVPLHVLVRRILTASAIAEATDDVIGADRAASGNFLIAGRDGEAVDLEFTPGGIDDACPVLPDQGVLAHANHFLSPKLAHAEAWLADGPDSPLRQTRAAELLLRDRGHLTEGVFRAILFDHANGSASICSHPDVTVDPAIRDMSVASLIMDITDGRLWLTAGLPCQAPYTEYAAADLFASVGAGAVVDWGSGSPDLATSRHA
jgi:isopenicillin-N N-acyltransferase-like protein